MNDETVELRRAIEALRAGVPNRDVVRHIEPAQADLIERFDRMLETAQSGWRDEKIAPGMLIEGDFGSGKSHWLEFFQHAALESAFICSTVTLNKETPLHDLGKLFRASVESAMAPGKRGPALSEIAHTYDPASAPGFRDLSEWTLSTPGLDPRFRATLLVFERTRDPDLRQQILDEWTGNPMRVPDLKAALKGIGERTSYSITRPLKGTLLQRFQFLTRFFISAGYNGWALLIDETELVSRYSLRQRARAYAHLAQLLGLVKEAAVPGMASVFTITKDYAGQVLYGRKHDVANIPARLQGTRQEEYIAAAETGMKAIQSRGLGLRPPTRDQVMEIYQKVRSLYSRAYGWGAPELTDRREYSSTTSLRQHIRSWITLWDLKRLYNYEAHTIYETVVQSYEEDPDLQRETPDTPDSTTAEDLYSPPRETRPAPRGDDGPVRSL
ncbi:MAG TPA: BREX system ATP-binding domain-containing protein [Armatimonadota bacterium]|nr:BREX system ATP-binding domain-containing protein [Armatimonadota bacterium]